MGSLAQPAAPHSAPPSFHSPGQRPRQLSQHQVPQPPSSVPHFASQPHQTQQLPAHALPYWETPWSLQASTTPGYQPLFSSSPPNTQAPAPLIASPASSTQGPSVHHGQFSQGHFAQGQLPQGLSQGPLPHGSLQQGPLPPGQQTPQVLSGQQVGPIANPGGVVYVGHYRQPYVYSSLPYQQVAPTSQYAYPASPAIWAAAPLAAHYSPGQAAGHQLPYSASQIVPGMPTYQSEQEPMQQHQAGQAVQLVPPVFPGSPHHTHPLYAAQISTSMGPQMSSQMVPESSASQPHPGYAQPQSTAAAPAKEKADSHSSSSPSVSSTSSETMAAAPHPGKTSPDKAMEVMPTKAEPTVASTSGLHSSAIPSTSIPSSGLHSSSAASSSRQQHSVRKRGSVSHSHVGPAPSNAPVVGATLFSFDSSFVNPIPRWQPGFSQDVKRRTRTGCLTCRRRRVKCDEQRPQCRNCMRSERVCLGYDTIFTRANSRRIEELAQRRKAFRGARKMRISSLLEATRAGLGSENTISDSDSTESGESSGDSKTISMLERRLGDNRRYSEGKPGETDLEAASWQEVAEIFRDHLSNSLDLLLGTTSLREVAERMVNFFKSSNGALIHVASEIEVMRQLLLIVHPSFNCHGLNILDCNLPLEKLRTSEDYCIMRALVEVLAADPDNPHVLHRAETARQQPEHPQRMDTTFYRIFNLGQILTRHAQVYGRENREASNCIPRDMLYELLDSPSDEHLTEAVWILVQTAVQDEKPAESGTEQHKIGEDSGCSPRTAENQSSNPTGAGTRASGLSTVGSLEHGIPRGQAMLTKMGKLLRRGDPRGSVALLALSADGCVESRRVLSSLEATSGLSLALVEIALLSSPNI